MENISAFYFRPGIIYKLKVLINSKRMVSHFVTFACLDIFVQLLAYSKINFNKCKLKLLPSLCLVKKILFFF